ncbi:MAG: tetratricopeptide repeat protein [Spirochaetota bacterium]|nr:tetratricopeptide repeat protein [Spirochaetota bacterium]
MKIKSIFKFLLLLIIPITIACDEKMKHDILFNYYKILKKEYKFVGKIVPVTIGQSIEIDGVFTRDGSYFFYSSDRERGNYDIYLRSLTDITTVRITSHASKDISPAISPNGKYLAFISQREDPEGDIYVVKVKPKRIIEDAKKTKTEVPSLDPFVNNITQFQDPASKTIKIIKDASPTWSPDSNSIAFSSVRDGLENIWLIHRKGKNLIQITKKGGMYPRFSEDGRSIIYISYRNKKSNGDVYIKDLATGKERRVTDTGWIELYPSFLGNSDEIIYTLIDRDTNNDGKIDLQDNSTIYYKNLGLGEEYPLTLYSTSSFAPRWSHLFNLPDKKDYEEVVVFSDQVGQNINLNIIPKDGIIPNRGSASRQYNLAGRYLDEYDDMERYLFCLERVYHFFGRRKDVDSIIFVSKALLDAAKKYKELGNLEKAEGLKSLLMSLSRNKNDFRYITSQYLENILSGKSAQGILLNTIERLGNDKKGGGYIPYLMEELGDEYYRLGRREDAVRTYSKINKEYPKYKRALHIHLRLGSLTYKSLQREISPSLLKVLGSSNIDLKNETINRLIFIFDKEKNPRRRISIAQGMLKRYGDKKNLPALIEFILGKTYMEMGDLRSAASHLHESLDLVRRVDLLFYKSNYLLGRIAEREKGLIDAERHYFQIARWYQLRWKQSSITAVVNKLIEYYEESGERAEISGNFYEAMMLYKRYVEILTYLHLIKRFEDIYNEQAARAHVLYIDAYSSWKGEDVSRLRELEKEYLKRLPIARMDFDKAHIYGLGYIYTKMALSHDDGGFSLISGIRGIVKSDIDGMMDNFSKAIDQIEWALFIDDTFIDPYILKGWIYQFVDLQRVMDEKKTGGKNGEMFSEFFPEYLWESNISIYEKALNTCDEAMYPEKEGNLHLNIANTYFLLTNYPKALHHYELVKKFKGSFNSKVEEALLYYHLGYCYWQEDQIARAREEMRRTLYIYETLASGKIRRYRIQIFPLYRFFALFSRTEGRYDDAIKWYNKILKHSEAYKIEIDRARYMQEIAYCYKAMGQVEDSLFFLKNAEALLKHYKDDERGYKLRWRIFGFGPLHFWDLGPDNAIIGENKIYTELDTLSKRLLNLSLRLDISLDKGEYYKAIEYYERRLSLLKGRDNEVDHEMKIKALNNIGYCYFRLSRYVEAREYFNRAWDYAADSDVDNQEGIFTSIMNMSNLYAFLLENNIESLEEPIREIELLTSRISEYRTNYEKKRFNQELDILIDLAKAQGRGVRDEEIETIRNRISKDGAAKYHKLNIVMGMLKYLKAEMLFNRGIDIAADTKRKRIEGSLKILRINRNIFNLYRDATKRFENALMQADEKQSKRLRLKLLLSLSVCQERIGFLDEALESLFRAKEIGENYMYKDLLWRVHYRLAGFMEKHGMEIEGEGFREIAEEYYRKAAGIVEDIPYFFTESIYRVKDLYDDYIGLLMDKKNWDRVLALSEKRYAILRLFAVVRSSPGFHNDMDREYFSVYLGIVKEINSLQNNISGVLEKGDPPNSKRILNITSELQKKRREYSDFVKTLQKERPLFASFISISESEIPEYDDNVVIYKFIERNGEYYAWRIITGRFEFRRLTAEASGSVPNMISKFLGEDERERRHRFIVLNEASLKLFREFGNRMDIPPFMFAPSVDRVKYFLSSNNISMGSLYYNGRGLKGRLSKLSDFKNISVIERDDGKLELSSYSILVDQRDELNPFLLFTKRLEPTLIVKGISDIDLDYINLLIESSLYSGVNTICLFIDMNLDSVSKALQISLRQPLDETQKELGPVSNVMALGFKGFEKTDRYQGLLEVKDREYNKFLQELKNGDVARAGMHLNRWRGYGDGKTNEEILYYLGLAEVQALKGELENSHTHLIKALQLSRDISSDLYTRALSYRILLLLQSGAIASAKALINESDDLPGFSNSIDCSIYESIIALAIDGIEPHADEFGNAGFRGVSFIPINKLRLLLAEYLYLFEYMGKAREVLSHWVKDYPESDQKILKAGCMMGKPTDSLPFSKRAKAIVSLQGDAMKMEDLGNRAIILAEGDGKYDYFSPYPVMYTLRILLNNNNFKAALSFINNININEIYDNSLWMDVIPLLSIIKRIYLSEERYEDVLSMEKMIEMLSHRLGISSLLKNVLYDEGVNLSLLGRDRESYQAAIRGIELTNKEDNLFLKYQLLLMENEMRLGKIDEALARGEGIKSNYDNEYPFVLDLLLSRIELLKILKEGKVSEHEWERVEALIIRALDLLDRNPGMLKEFNRIDLISECLDFLISYKMSRMDYLKALVYAEVKKQIYVRLKMPVKASPMIPKGIKEEFRNMVEEDRGERFIGLLQRYPGLQLNSLIKMLPVEEYQKKMPEDFITLYLVKNGMDILAWIITKSFIEPLRIKQGYRDVSKILPRYRERLTKFENTVKISEELFSIFKPISKYYQGKGGIIFITDKELEQVPFEIMGEKTLLVESHSIVYISSIISALRSYKSRNRIVSILNLQQRDIFYELEEVAIKESGINYRITDSVNSGIAHIQHPLLYNSMRGEFYFGDKLINSLLAGVEIVYIPSIDFTHRVSCSKFAIASSQEGVRGLIINDAELHDVNNAIFIDNLYSEINRESSLIRAFEHAKYSIRANNRYKHPAYWAGIRLYLNGL